MKNDIACYPCNDEQGRIKTTEGHTERVGATTLFSQEMTVRFPCEALSQS